MIDDVIINALIIITSIIIMMIIVWLAIERLNCIENSSYTSSTIDLPVIFRFGTYTDSDDVI